MIKIVEIKLTKLGNYDKPSKGYEPLFEFHILNDIRQKYRFEELLFGSSGNVIFPNYHTVRIFAQKLNSQRDLVKFPEQAIKIGQLNAMGLIDEIFHFVFRLYEDTANPGVISRAITTLKKDLSNNHVINTLLKFTQLFPPLDVYRNKMLAEHYLSGKTGDRNNIEVSFEEIIMLHFANINPAFTPFKELFTDDQLSKETIYKDIIKSSELFFQSEKRFGPNNQFIFDMIKAPIVASPNSLKGQLEYIKKHWGMLLSGKYLDKILSADDLIKEDSKIIFLGGQTPTAIPDYKYDDLINLEFLEIERFTKDLDWMPNVVLIAKNIYVWLDQLSKKYNRPIKRLDEIPDEELDQLARWNFTALWLIGIWERSPASRKIKQMMGNPEAVASAYSIYDYEIAHDIGGEDAFKQFRYRAWQRGIRLAGDMVPNHMGIYSKWVIEHPEYFISSDYSPFPNYQFTGPDLSDHPDIQLRIEDGYFTRRDAAVVFQRIDNRTGKVKYIYHGNDGTNMPWNDTAQLNFLKSEVREAVIKMIFHVAKIFPIIRFDAAMTLTKMHFQRLWFPEPGTGGDIPSRSDYAMSKSEFNKLFPQEFWREVVDRINNEMPDTLLLAEAFWLLEGYFVRTLGMHRVYNSAFMNMIMKEENSKYRELIKSTLEFNPEILKRYVNFMSNPDEQTAVVQFGKGDKYFGTALMMVTLPGLPMFAHGQIEGFTEKYGMEYQKAYYNEQPDEDLIRRHEYYIFPIMKKRYLFSGVSNFELYDLTDSRGFVNENVFVYSNKAGVECAIACYNNKYEEASGWIKNSVGKNIKKNLAEALGFNSNDNFYYIFKEYVSGLEFIRSGKELNDVGLYIELKAYQFQLFIDFREVYDSNGIYQQLTNNLGGRAVPNIQTVLEEFQLKPVHDAFKEIFTTELFNIASNILDNDNATQSNFGKIETRYSNFLKHVKIFLPSSANEASIIKKFRENISHIPKLSKITNNSLKLSCVDKTENLMNSITLFIWLTTYKLGQLLSEKEIENYSIQIFHNLHFEKIIRHILNEFGFEYNKQTNFIKLIKILIVHHNFLKQWIEGKFSFNEFLNEHEIREFIGLNFYNGIWYYNKEQFQNLFKWLCATAFINQFELDKIEQYITDILKISDQSQYQLDIFKENIKNWSLK